MIPWLLQWQNLILLGLAYTIIYPDRLLLWLGSQMKRTFVAGTVIVVEIVAVPLMAIVTRLLMTFYAAIDWSDMLICIGAVGLVRIIYWVGNTLIRWLFDI